MNKKLILILFAFVSILVYVDSAYAMHDEKIDHPVTRIPPHPIFEAPLKQVQSGVPIQEVQCNEDLHLNYKRYTFMPVCLTMDTESRLVGYGYLQMRILGPGDIINQENLCKGYPDVELIQRSCNYNLLTSEPVPHSEPPPVPMKCKSGPAPSDDYYFDEESCEWLLISEPRVSEVFPYIWNGYLNRNSIDFSPKETIYANNQPGFYDEKENRVCSSLVAENGSEFYISSTFNIEPLEIIQTVITQIQPVDCQRIWKTDIILVEPDPELLGWLEKYYKEL